MNEDLLQRLRAGRAECPSDLLLDRLAAGELPAAQAAQLQAHTGTCPACAAHMKEARFDALPVDAAALLARIRRGMDRPSLWQRLLGSWALRAPVLAVAGACLVLVLIGRPTPHPGPIAEDPGTRAKGGAILHVHRMLSAGSEEVLSGARLAPGDRLRFVVDLPRPGYVAILGVEEGGGLYAAWPTDGTTPQARPAGSGQALPGAVALDETPGTETLYLVHCPGAAAPPRCQARGGRKPPLCPEGCALSPFVIHKDRR